jgi:plastocyanin
VLLAVALAGSLGSEEIVVEVPLGTAERMAAGEEVELLPRTLRVAVGDRLRIVNHDDAPHEVGPYAVAPGQTLEQTFTSPGTLEGLCTLHPSGAITIEVR